MDLSDLLGGPMDTSSQDTRPPPDDPPPELPRQPQDLANTPQRPSTKVAVQDTNYTEKKSSKKPKPKVVKAAKKPAKATSDVDVNAVPNPAPDTGVSHSGALYPPGVIYHGVLPVVVPSTTSHLPASTSGFSPLPPLAAFATSVTMSSLATSSLIPTSTPVSQHLQSHSAPPKHLPTVIIVLLAIGAAFLLVGCYIVYRVLSRPRKHHYPTPSLPILQDDYLEEGKIDPEEESLFGGKERNSARPGSGEVLLDWTQYPHVSVSKPPATLDVNAARPGSPPKRKSAELKPGYPFTGPNATASNTGGRSVSRLSTVSASVYPGSPMSGHIGVAVTGSPLTADGTTMLQRTNTKPPARRMSVSAKNARQSMLVADRRNLPSTYGTSDLYGGAATPMPPTPATPRAVGNSSGGGGGGRARVKAPYAPASLLRTSTGGGMQENSNPFEDSIYTLPPINPVTKSEDCRERDTKALASALGLASPVPPSPQTIYPDDSITLAGDRDRRRSRSHFLSPTLDTSANLGKLMLSDFQSVASLPDVGPGPSRKPAPTTTRRRVEEKPPRVPSPPPMPSLAQMALAHTNPMDFEDYRSPTYSIYGLYEADRRNRDTADGGY